MLQLKNIKKIYGEKGKEQVEALKGISLEFRDKEFVSILGPSGCGKTTFLNIIGGLDKYTAGDLIINGKSTKKFKDRDWDTYRNHSVGFVFQSYNLISHQSILSNVELALTLAGTNKKERREKAIKALEDVGLKNKIHKKPTELSGGQMQRVAIARALVSNPDILLADEPTGALDTNTSVQIMELLKKVAKDRLVIMVTHNSDIAQEYSTRIIKLLDGKVIDDSNPYTATKDEIEKSKNNASKINKTKLKFSTALNLSLKNLLTKKGRTILTSFAGSIGIIGIALIMSLSNGMHEYISKVQKETMSEYPIIIDRETMNIESMIKADTKYKEDEENTSTVEEGKIASNDDLTKNQTLMLQNSIIKNNLEKFKEYLDSNEKIKDYASAIQYSYDIDLQVYDSNTENDIVKINPNPLTLSKANEKETTYSVMDGTTSVSNNMEDAFKELIDSQNVIDTQYNLISGRMPEKYNELLLVVDKNMMIPESILYTINMKDRKEFEDIKQKIIDGKEVKIDGSEYNYEDFIGKKFKLVNASDYYSKVNGKWMDNSKNQNYMKNIISKGEDIEIVGIVKVNSESVTESSATSGYIGYTHELIKHVISEANGSEVVKEQLENKDKNILTGIYFDVNGYIDNLNKTELRELAQKQLSSQMSSIEISGMLGQMSDDDLKSMLKAQLADSSSLEKNLKDMGYIDLKSPKSISIYPNNFESKEEIEKIINEYNQERKDSKEDGEIISYTDYVGLMMSSITNIINIITYVLIAFVAISLIVSSIMIAIITYISVLERAKEIGILRSIGASKRDVSKVFNAETFIEGFIAGTFGIGITLLLCIPINIVIEKTFSVKNLASLPVEGGIGLIALSILLTMFAGIIPSKIAAKKDPAVALRSE